MEFPFKYLMLLIALVLLTQCRNIVIGEDSLPGDSELNFQDQSFDIGRGEVTVLDIKNWVSVNGGMLVEVKNPEELDGRYVITKDGFLGYKAPMDKDAEGILLELKDYYGNTAAGNIDFRIQNMPVLTGCNVGGQLEEINIFEQSTTISTVEFTGNNLACGLPPTDEFEVLFPPQELLFEYSNSALTILPAPGGIGQDVLSYLGKLEDGTPYAETILINNALGCFEGPEADFLGWVFEPTVESYDLQVLENDEFCTFTQEDANIIDVSEIDNGTLEIVDGQFLKYMVPAMPSLPIQDTFSYTAEYKTNTGVVVKSVECTLVIVP